MEEVRESHRKNLKAFLQRMKDLNIRQNFEKGKFAVGKATYMGHAISDKRVQPDPRKIAAIGPFPTPQSIKELKRWMGMVNYLAKIRP